EAVVAEFNEMIYFAAEIVRDTIKVIIENSFLRFLALNIEKTKYLVDSYLDFDLFDAQEQPRITNVLITFQGCFFSQCIRLTKNIHFTPDGARAFVVEFAQLLESTRIEAERWEGTESVTSLHAPDFKRSEVESKANPAGAVHSG